MGTPRHEELTRGRLKREMREVVAIRQRATIVELLNAGATAEQVVEVMARGVTLDPRDSADPDATRFPMSSAAVLAFLRELRSDRLAEFDALRAYHKSEQAARLMADLVRMRSQQVKPWNAIARHEELLAKVLGTLEPVSVNLSAQVETRQAIAMVLAKLPDAEVDRLAEQGARIVAQLGEGE